MPKANNNAITAGWKGTFRKQVVFRQRNGQTIISSYPDMSERVLSPAQLKINELMKKANQHIGAILSDEQSRREAQVRLNVPSNRLYNALIKEYYKNNYKREEETTEVPAEGELPEIPGKNVNYEFMKYLLENTNKSIAEISTMTKIDAGIVSVFQEKYRQPEQSNEELVKKFKEMYSGNQEGNAI